MCRRLLTLSLLSLAALGCGNEDAIDEVVRVAARTANAACGECRSTLWTEAECRMRYEIDPTREACLRRANELDPSVARYFECKLAPTNALADCLEAIVDDGCTNALFGQQDCLTAQQTAYQDCALEFPTAEDAIDAACSPSP